MSQRAPGVKARGIPGIVLLLMLRSFFSRHLGLPRDRAEAAVHLLLLAVTIQAAVVFSISIAQSLFLAHAGAARLPVFYLLLALFSLPLAAGMSSLLGRRSNLALLAGALLLTAALSLGLGSLYEAAPVPGAYAVYLAYFLLGLQVLALYAALLSEYLTALELKRFVVFLAMAGAVGGLAGGLALRWASARVSPTALLLAAAAIFALAAAQLAALGRLGGTLDGGEPAPREGLLASLGGLSRLRRRYPMVALLAVNGLLLTVIHSIFQAGAFDVFARRFPTAGELTPFLGTLNAALKVLELVVAYAVTRPLLRHLGVGPANLAYPLTCLAAFLGLAVSPTLSAALLASFNYRTLGNSLAGPVSTLNYNAVPRRWVGRLRVLIGSLVYPAGLALAGVVLLLLQRLGQAAVAGLGILLAAVFLGLGALTTRAYFRSLLSMLRARTVNLGEVEEGLVRLPASHAEPVREMLASDDSQQQLLALELLVRMDAEPFAADLAALAARAGAGVARALVGFFAQQGDFTARGGPRLLASENPEVRAAALEALLVDTATAVPQRRRLAGERLQDPSPEARSIALVAAYRLAPDAAALAAVAGQGRGGDSQRRRMFEAMAASGQNPKVLLIEEVLTSAEPAGRLAAFRLLRGMASRGDAELLELGRGQRAGPDADVRRAAGGLLAAVCTAGQLGELARSLEDTAAEVRDAAARHLAERGRDGEAAAALAVAEPYLASPRAEVQGAAVAAIGGLGTGAAEEILERHLESDFATAETLRGWLRQVPGDTFWTPLRLAVRDAARRLRRRVFAVLAALGEEDTLHRVRQLLRSPDRRLRADAVETFGSIGHRRLTQPIVRLLEVEIATSDPEAAPADAALDPEALLRRAAADGDPWIALAAHGLARQLGVAPPGSADPTPPTPATDLVLSEVGEPTPVEDLMSRLLFLAKMPLFQNLTLDELAVLDTAFEQLELLEGETVFTEGQLGDRFYLVAEGKVVFAKRSGRESLEVGRAGPGEYFGDMALFDECPRTASAVAAADSILLALDRDRLHSLVQQRPDIAWEICRELSMRLRESNERLRSLDMQLKASA